MQEKEKSWRGCCTWNCTKAFILKNFLPLGFAVSIIWMLAWPWPGAQVAKWRVRFWAAWHAIRQSSVSNALAGKPVFMVVRTCSCNASMQVGNYGIMETICIIIIFLISGLALKTEDILVAIKKPGPLCYGIIAILGITPCLGFATIRLPLSPPEFAIGAGLLQRWPAEICFSCCCAAEQRDPFHGRISRWCQRTLD